MNSRKRRPLALLNSYGINHLHLRNPLTVVWLSATFPGFGHIYLCKYGLGFVLILWEFVINVKSGLNSAIYYSMVGDIGHAKEILKVEWVILYIAVYVFGMWDTYRLTLELNKLTLLAEPRSVVPTSITPWEVNFLAERKPWVAVVWSILLPGLGQLYLNRLVLGIISLGWWIIASWKSQFICAVYYSMMGQFSMATSALDPQWLLFLPSLYCFALYDAYINCIELNKIFRVEQAAYLMSRYSNPAYPIPYGPKES